MPGPSLIQTAATDHRPLTSGVSPRTGMPSGVSESRPLMAYLIADALVAEDVGHQLERLLHLQVEVVLGERQLGGRQRRRLDRGDVVGVVQDRPVGVGADLQAGAVLALVHVGVHVADDRVLDLALGVREHVGTGPTSIIWCTAGVSGMMAPAMRAMRGLHTPQAMIDVRRPRCRPGRCARAVTWPSFDVDVEHLGVGEDGQRAQLRWPRSRISVPVRSESTTPTLGV